MIDADLLNYMSDEDKAELDELLTVGMPVWQPQDGPQTDACESLADVVGFGGSAGGGKGLALDTPLPTPTGWTTIGAVCEGDILIDENGFPCNVVAVSEVSLRPCFRLIFDDGAELVADDVHRWVTFDAKELAALTRRNDAWREVRRASRPSRAKVTTSPKKLSALEKLNRAHAAKAKAPPVGTMRDTAEIFATARTESGRSNHAIKMQEALQASQANLLIPPYTLGAWLGDGSSRNGQLTGNDQGIWERIESDGFEVRHYARDKIAHSIIGLMVKLRDIGVLCNKHIPASYLRSSYDQRLALLQGLMDTDGHAATDGGCEFDSTNERLAYGVLELADTLGIKATMQRGVAKLNGREISKKWRVKFTTSLPVFGLERKAIRLPKRTRRVSQFRYLVACESVESVPTKCIAVDSPSRQYLAGRRMVPTHNTDLAVGLALTQHRKTAIFRETGTELLGIIDRIAEILGSRDGFNGKDNVWRFTRHDGIKSQIELGSFPNLGDEKKQQGRPHDLLIFDEAANMREAQVRFLLGWLRSAVKGQRCRAIMTFNPPTKADGRWVIEYFAPWIDKKHPNPAKPGELRWYGTVNGKDISVADGREFVLVDNAPCYEFDRSKYKAEDIIKPLSRTFIPSRVSDNKYLRDTGYIAQLQSLPEPLRSQMLRGDFAAGMQDDPWQVIPTAWVEIAQARWKKPVVLEPMDSVGVDVALGGGDNTVIARRHAMWFDEAIVYPGEQCTDGPTVGGFVISAIRNGAPVHLDLFGVGAKPYGHLKGLGVDVYGIDVGNKSDEMDENSVMGFFNLRSQLVWRMREALDPHNNTGIALPPERILFSELCAFTWQPVTQNGKTVIKVCSREDIVERIGHSPDYASAYCLALLDTPKREYIRSLQKSERREYNPFDALNR